MEKIKILGLRLAQLQAKAVLTATYIILVPLFALLLKIIIKEKIGWNKWRIKSDTLDQIRKQF